MAAVVEKSMQELQLDKVDAAVEPKVTELHVYGTTAADNAEAVKAVAQPGTPVAAEKASATDGTAEKLKKQRRRRGKKPAPGKENVAPKDVAPAGPVDVAACVEINQCDGCTRQFFTKSFLGDGAAVLARWRGEERAPPRYRAGVASMKF